MTLAPFAAPEEEARKNQARKRFLARESRLAQEKLEQKTAFPEHSLNEKKKYIEAALARVQAKKKKGEEKR